MLVPYRFRPGALAECFAISGAGFGLPWPAPHRHVPLEMNLVIAGGLSCRVDGQRVDLEAGDLLWLFPGQEHVLLAESRARMWVAVFAPRLVRSAAGWGEGLRRRNPGVIVRRLGRADRLRLDGHCRELAEGGPAGLANARGTALLAEAWSAGDAAPAPTTLHPAVVAAARRIEAGGDDTFPQLAARCGLSRDRLGRLFRRQLGLTLAEHRNRARLRIFLGLAEAGRGDLLRLALDAGFGSYMQFFRVFRAATGMSPRVWLAGRGSSRPRSGSRVGGDPAKRA